MTKEYPPFIRFVILGIATLCATSVLSNMVIYNFTKICAEPYDQVIAPGQTNFTRMSSEFSTVQQTLLKAASAIGALVAGFPYTYLYQRFPSRYVFLSAGVISVASTSLIPWTYHLGFGAFLAARIIQGCAFSTTFQLYGCICSDWAALGEHGIFLAFLTGATQLSNIFTMPVAGALCDSSWGWPSVYYVHSAVCLVLFIIWFLVYRDHPSMHSAVSAAELERVSRGKVERDVSEKREPIPYLKILLDPSILSCWVAAFADLLYVQLVSQYQPVYFNDYLSFDVLNSGFISAVPIIAQFVMKLIAGFSSDALTCVTPTMNVKLYDTIALFASGVGMIIISFLNRHNTITCVVGLTIAVSFTGFVTAGFNKCATLRSRQHAHFAMNQIMNLWAITILIEPFIVDAILTDRQSESQWRIVFIIHGGIAILANFVFIFFADARPAPWTENVKYSSIEKPKPSQSDSEKNGTITEC